MSDRTSEYHFTFSVQSVDTWVQCDMIVSQWIESFLKEPRLVGKLRLKTDAFFELLETMDDPEPFSLLDESSDINALKGLAGLASGEMRDHILQEIERIPKAREAKKHLESEGEQS